jgi:hypothetical protein
MTFKTWSRPAVLGSALGLIPLFGCFGPSNDKGDNSGGKPLPHDGTTRDDFSHPRDNAGTITTKTTGFGTPGSRDVTPPSPAPK